MINREKKYSDELAACRKSIDRTKKLLEYHKNMLKNLEGKEKELFDKLQKEKFTIFFELVSRKGYDIDELRSAAAEGDFSGISVKKTESGSTELSEEIIPDNSVHEETLLIECEKEITEDENE